MWVRSQDKTILLKANYVRKNGSFIEAVHSDMGFTLIGKYSTEKKALKVLDMIQQWINDIEYAKTTQKYRAFYVFEMPQENEV
jgi:hypothetical protein